MNNYLAIEDGTLGIQIRVFNLAEQQLRPIESGFLQQATQFQPKSIYQAYLNCRPMLRSVHSEPVICKQLRTFHSIFS